ncbi:hypothetical protein ES705_25630 [subsurface metagenome]
MVICLDTIENLNWNIRILEEYEQTIRRIKNV